MTEPTRSTPDAPRILVVAQDGSAVPSSDAVLDEEAQDQAGDRPITELVEQPAKVMRIGSMVKQLLDEVRAAPLDEASRTRLREIHRTSLKELENGLAPELIEELERITLPFSDEDVPSDAELRIAQAQLVGWLEGLFHGIQTAMFVQQMEARAAMEGQARRALPSGLRGPVSGGEAEPRSTGQYL